MLLTLALVLVWWFNQELVLEWKRSLSATHYYLVLALGGTLGIPALPFYLAGGALFGWTTALIGSSLALLGMQLLSYLLAHSLFRRWSLRVGQEAERRVGQGVLRSPASRVLVIRMLPVLPTAVKNYAAAAVGASLTVYLAVSWPVGFAFAAAMVLLGDSAATGNVGEAGLALLLVLPLGWGAWQLRRRLAETRRRAQQPASMPLLWATPNHAAPTSATGSDQGRLSERAANPLKEKEDE